ncbi:TNF receptor-associated factor 4-like [Tubulanus polymorphus]|uniref:TNF receptor-associated factor 4-like n=1 Tax=Tubulanus polymorphus TaxID=672921 RepID=UPI003DA61D40
MPEQTMINGELQGMSQSPPMTGNSTPRTPSMGPRRGSILSNLSGASKNSYGSSVSSRPEVEVIFVKPLDKKYECPVCCQVLRYPVQFEECGHRCCSSCLPELLRVAPRCPIDQVHVERDKICVDKAFQKETDNLAVQCSNQSQGCEWEGCLKDLGGHVEECGYSMTSCPNQCGVDFQKRFLDKHMESDCPKRPVECDFCQQPILSGDEVDHLNECPNFPIPCPNNCGVKDILRSELDNHTKNACPLQNIDCPFAPFGCEKKCLRREIDAHLQTTTQDHLTTVCNAMVSHKSIFEEQAQVLDEHIQKVEKMEKKVDKLEKMYGVQFLWRIDKYEERLADAKSGKKTTIFSPPFYSHRHGYKMTVSVCLYGDGRARGKHMSLFVCIMRGDYDPLLTWPFSHRITFTLIDQCQDPAARRNIQYSIKPNTCKENRPFLGRPSSERNASFGAQKFIELDIMNTLDYIRDDTIFIKVSIDTEEISMV